MTTATKLANALRFALQFSQRIEACAVDGGAECVRQMRTALFEFERDTLTPHDADAVPRNSPDHRAAVLAEARTAPELLTVAYIGAGVRTAIDSAETFDADPSWSGELGLMDACASHALMLDRMADAVMDHAQGVYAYEVAEQFGQDIARAYMAGGNVDAESIAREFIDAWAPGTDEETEHGEDTRTEADILRDALRDLLAHVDECGPGVAATRPGGVGAFAYAGTPYEAVTTARALIAGGAA